MPLDELDRAIVESEEAGFVKVLTKKGSDKILGVTFVGAHAGDLLHEFVLAMKQDIGLGAIAATIHAYPTFAELARKAGDQIQQDPPDADREEDLSLALSTSPQMSFAAGNSIARYLERRVHDRRSARAIS